MPWTEPTLKQLVEQNQQDLSNRLLDGRPLSPDSVLAVMATTLAGGQRQMYYFLAWAFKQVFPDTAEGEFMARWAAVWYILRKQAAPAAGLATVSGLAGTVVPEDTLAQTEDGLLAFALAGGTLPQGAGEQTMEMALKAVAPGAAGNLAAGTTLTLVSPVAGLSSTVAVGPAGLAGGVDLEDDESLRARLLKRLREPPHGGSKTDYEQWALQVPGVINAVCFPEYAGLGTVGVAVWGQVENPVLPEAVVQRAYDHILPLAPVTAGPGLYVFTPEPLAVDIVARIVPDTPQVRENVRLELGDVFAREGKPGGVIPRSHLTEALSLAAGEYDHYLTSPEGNIYPEKYQLPVLGEITFVGE
ncbi:baseplate J/gp47 family protein [Deltaproteobacteria bacterium OttesenSCG-928-M10]|nr:baseplate J/gp47 family protein [Deltaproteobacteria bacterium OttesenSCG-928-M10]